VRRVLDNHAGPARDIVLFNAGAALYAANVADSLANGIERAREALASGLAADRLYAFVQTTQGFKPAA
jgi:anthranilate phosphoribosyltransferase